MAGEESGERLCDDRMQCGDGEAPQPLALPNPLHYYSSLSSYSYSLHQILSLVLALPIQGETTVLRPFLQHTLLRIAPKILQYAIRHGCSYRFTTQTLQDSRQMAVGGDQGLRVQPCNHSRVEHLGFSPFFLVVGFQMAGSTTAVSHGSPSMTWMPTWQYFSGHFLRLVLRVGSSKKATPNYSKTSSMNIFS